MNARAAELGASDSHFVNPDGYHHPDHYTTARDLLSIALAVEQVPLLREILLEEEAEVSLGETTVVWKNGNALLRPRQPLLCAGRNGHENRLHRCGGGLHGRLRHPAGPPVHRHHPRG